ncbi:hypothetical protein BH11MYX1_BH11MYX1_50690 [soil metagenome]
MLLAMSRAIWLVPLLVAGCSTSGKQDKDTAPTTAPAPTGAVEHIDMGRGATAISKGIEGAPGAPKGTGTDDVRFHLHADEGTLTIAKASGKAGSELVSTITIKPASEFHVNTEFPVKLTLEPTDGLTLAKSEFTAGGMSKAVGDAASFTEQGLAIAVKATAAKPGTYEVKGTFKFAVCKDIQCFPKKQPITITIDAT